jgi:hypothetical protein
MIKVRSVQMKIHAAKLTSHVLTICTCALWLFIFSVKAQSPKQLWERVYTGEDSIIEVDPSSLTFLENRIARVVFRTTFSTPEHLPNKPDTTYQNQLETTEFQLNGLNYRLAETTLLNSSGKIVFTQQAGADDGWRVIKKGGMMKRLFESVREIAPLGDWKVVGFRSGNDGAVLSASESEKLLHMNVTLATDRAEVGGKSCSSPVYRSESLTKNDFVRKLGMTADSLGLLTDLAEAIEIKCVTGGWRPPQSLLLKLNNDGMLILWDGVFMELRRPSD